MTSSPRAPPPPLTFTGATLGTKQAQRKRNHPLVWTLMSQAGIEDSIKPNSFEQGDHSHSGELLIYKKGSSHSRGTRFMLTVALLLVYGAVIS